MATLDPFLLKLRVTKDVEPLYDMLAEVRGALFRAEFYASDFMLKTLLEKILLELDELTVSRDEMANNLRHYSRDLMHEMQKELGIKIILTKPREGEKTVLTDYK